MIFGLLFISILVFGLGWLAGFQFGRQYQVTIQERENGQKE